MNPTLEDKAIEKLYFSAKEASELTGLNKGLCYYYRGQYRKNKPESHQGFNKREIEFLKSVA